MYDILMEWLGYLARWGHVLAGITWVGTSFYFNWLDLSERPPKSKTLKPNVVGEVHEMHGGSFYYHERFWPTEDNPRTLAHAGPAQLTFLTGMLLIFHIYWMGADVYLVDGSAGFSTTDAIFFSALILFVPWLFYHNFCNAVTDEKTIVIVMGVVVIITSFLATQIFSGRAAFIHIGAMLGTIMALNVHFVIIPNHILMRKQVQASEPVNQHYHKLAKRRSQHNNYFTLPVVFLMLSVHFPLATSGQFAWLVLVLMVASGFTLRLRQNRYLITEKKSGELAIIAVLLIVLAIGLSSITGEADQEDVASLSGEEAEIFAIVQERCTVCHSASPSFEGFTSPPGGVRFETMDHIRSRSGVIITQAIDSDIMPPGNMTEMTDVERKKLGDWLAAAGSQNTGAGE